jgi:hypothetical protein
MIVGREYIVGGQHDYDELLDHAMGAETPAPPPPPHPAQQHPHAHHHAAPPPAPYPYAPPYPPPYPPSGWAPPHPRATSPAYDRDPHGPRLVQNHPRHARQFPIGLVKNAIAPGDAQDIEVKPQVHFRGERLAVAPSISRFFNVVDIKVGKDSQLAAVGEMPAESFSALAVGVRLELDTAQPGIVITVRVRNTDAAAHDFAAVLYGTVLE